ncbi:hypothetical protein BHM03_00055269 [Ensete ventricosum]|nr:hypothetical protein BHM03_00055269 [Ensete ventricosum]
MRLNRVELFYALVAAIGSESRRRLGGRGGHMHAVYMQRWLATARPPVGTTGHGQASCRDDRPWPGYLQGPTGCSQGPLQRGDRMRPSPLRLRPAHKGLSLADSPAASKGGDTGHSGGRPLVGRLPAAKGSRRLRRGSNSGGTVRIRRARVSF